MKKHIRYLAALFGLVALMVISDGMRASTEARPLSNNEVRRAVTSGQVVPYSVAASQARAFTKGGDVLRAKLVTSGGGLRYRLRMLLPNGRVMIVFVDARSGRVIGSR